MKQIGQSVKNANFFWLFTYSLIVGAAGGMSTALYLYNVTYFFEFTGSQIAVTGVFVFASPAIAYFLAPALGKSLGKKRAAMAALFGAIFLYPIPYIATLSGLWPESGSWDSLMIYSVFVMTEVVGFIVGGVMLDSMMADVVEDSEVNTNRRSEGLFYAARSFASKAVSALGIVLAGSIVSLVGMDGIQSVDDMTMTMRGDLAGFFLPAYCGLYCFAIYLISRYKIDRETHQKNLDRLAEQSGPG
jgi:Na+/melibiose symporter-like transporter